MRLVSTYIIFKLKKLQKIQYICLISLQNNQCFDTLFNYTIAYYYYVRQPRE